MKPTPTRRALHLSSSALLTALALSVTVPSVQAAVRYWDPNSSGTFGTINGTTTWTAPLHIVWTGSPTGNSSRLQNYTTTFTDECNWGGPIGTTNSNLGGGTVPVATVNAQSLGFNNIVGSGTVLLSGGTITLAATTSVSATSAGPHTISSTLAGGATSFSKLGTGTIVLSGSNTFTGPTLVSAGTLTLANPLALANSPLDTSASILGDDSNGLKTTVTSLTLGGLTGDKELATLFTTNVGGYDTVTSLTLNPATGFTHTYSAGLADGAVGMNLIKSGAGTQVLAGANTHTGSTTLRAGTLTLDYTTQDASKLADAAPLVLGTGTLILAGGSHTEVVASSVLTGNTLVTRSSGTAKIALGNISGTGTIDFAESNIATTTNANDASGILGGFATVGGTNFAANDGNGNIIAFNAYVDITARGPSTITNSAGANVRILGDGTSGNIELGETTTTIKTLLQSNATFPAIVNSVGKTLATNSVVVTSGCESLSIGAAPGAGTLRNPDAGGTLVLNNYNVAKSLTINAAIPDNTTASGLAKGGEGEVVLAGANTYTGPTVLGKGTLTLNGSLVDTAISVTSDAVLNQSSTGAIAGVASLSLLSTATSTLSGANSYNGLTSVENGVLIIQNASALGTVAEGTTVGSGAALQILGGITIGDEALTLNGSGPASTGALRNLAGNNTWGGLITLGSAARINNDTGTLTLSNPGSITGPSFGLTIGGAGDTVINSAIDTASGSLAKQGTGTLTLTGASTYSNSTTVSAGILNIQHSSALGTSAGGVTVVNGAALQLQGGLTIGNEALSVAGTGSGGTGVLRSLGGDSSWGGPVTLAGHSRINCDAGTLTFDVPSGSAFGVSLNAPFNITFGGSGNISVADSIITLTGSVTKDGTGTLTLAGNSTYTGGTVVNAGTLVVSTPGCLGTGAVSINGGTLRLNTAITSGFINVNSGGTLLLGVDPGSTPYNLAGGTLDIGGLTLTNALTLPAGSSLTGSGTLVAALDICDSTVNPGNGTGTLTFTNNINLALAGPVNLEIGGTTTGLYDTVVANGPIALSGAVTVAFVNGFIPSAGHSWDLFADDGGFTSTADLILPALPDGLIWNSSQFATSGLVSIQSTTNPYLGWQTSKFTPAELLLPLISGTNADPDGDGLSNLLEYALGSDPRSPQASALPLPTVPTLAGQNHTALTFRRLKGTHDLSFVLEVSPTPAPAGFTAVPATLTIITDHGDGTETVTLRETAPFATGTTTRFVRLRIVQN